MKLSDINPVKVLSGAKDLVSGTGLGIASKLHPGGLVAALAKDTLEALGAPKWLSSLASAGVNAYTGNYGGAIMDGVDVLANIEPPPNRSKAAEEGRGWRAGPARPEAPSTPRPSCTGSAAPAPAAPAPSAAGSAASTGATSDSEGVSEKRKLESDGMKAAKDFNAKHADPESFMNAVRNGEIPEEILMSQGGLMALQQRLADIQRMNALMTQMMKSMHDMEMEIVRNIRT